MECAGCGNPAAKRCPCRTVRYCGFKCQRAHWAEHKDDCRRLRAEQTVVMPPRPWYNFSPPEMAQHCLEFVLRARNAKEHGVDDTEAEAKAFKMVDEGSGVGLPELERALKAARAMFVPECDADLDDLPRQSGDTFGDNALDVQRMLGEAAQVLLEDSGFHPYVGDWVAYCFDGRVLLGKTPTMVKPPKATPEQAAAIKAAFEAAETLEVSS